MRLKQLTMSFEKKHEFLGRSSRDDPYLWKASMGRLKKMWRQKIFDHPITIHHRPPILLLIILFLSHSAPLCTRLSFPEVFPDVWASCRVDGVKNLGPFSDCKHFTWLYIYTYNSHLLQLKLFMWSKLNSEIMIVSIKNAPTFHFLAPEQEEVAKLHWVQNAAAIGDGHWPTHPQIIRGFPGSPWDFSRFFGSPNLQI